MKIFCHCFAGFLLLSIIIARAEEGGSGHYSPGSMASFVDVLPDTPSFAPFTSFSYYSGNAGASKTFEIAGNLTLNAKATVYAASLGTFWVSPYKILGANYATGICIPLVTTDVDAQASLSAVGSASRHSSATGVGDIEIW